MVNTGSNSESESQTANYLMVTWDGAGNLPPERSLVRALVERGHQVDVLAHPSVQQKFEADGAHFHAYRNVLPYSSLEQMDLESEFQNTFDNIIFAPGAFDDTVSLAKERNPDVLLIDGMLPYALLAGRFLGIPTIAMMHSLYGLVLSGPFADAFNARIDEVNSVGSRHKVAPASSYRELLEADQVLVFSYGQGFDEHPRLPDNVVHVGPLRSIDPESQGKYEPASSSTPLVVVALSTSYMDQHAVLQKICDAVAGLPVQVLVTTGQAVAPDSLFIGPNTDAQTFVAHDLVLPHARLLVTHAGHGTVAAGLEYGVPLLCIPLGRDQPLVAEKVVDLGLGALVTPDASVGEIQEAIERLVTDRGAQQRAQAFAQQLRTHDGIERAIEIAETSAKRA
jgi:UDP:flavonoid glycosyltransferase YjiC (YdhE family)